MEKITNMNLIVVRGQKQSALYIIKVHIDGLNATTEDIAALIL